MKTLVTIVTIALLSVASTPGRAHATCSCMLRPPPPASTTGDVARDPSYTPTAAVFVARIGTHTVLTMETAYVGPATELSMVIPVPGPIEREQVRTVSGSVFRTLDRRTAPRVRHVWPSCRRRRRPRMMASADGMGGGGGSSSEPRLRLDEYGVDVEDEWEVDEYDMTLLGADESTGLLRFLRDRGLELPDVAAEVLRAYIETGHRFILVDVDPTRAHQLGDKMMLSPIQIEYDSEELRVPVRLGTLNSPGEQELLLYVLSTDGRYEVANRPGVVAPSDLRLSRDARGGVAELYRAISDEIFRQNPGAAVTEYAHVLGSRVTRFHVSRLGIPRRARSPDGTRDRWTLTRIRHRYGTDLDDDLTLRPAEEPLRLTRRWPYRGVRTYGPRGESAFHIQYVAVHSGCASAGAQRRYARQWATAQSLWEADRDLWPGSVLRDPIESLGIEAGSEAPEGWPPPPPEIQPPPIARRDGAMEPLRPTEEASEEEGVEAAAEVTETETASPPAAPPAAAEESSGFCAIGAGRPTPWLAVGWWLAVAWLGFRRRANVRRSSGSPAR